MQLLNKGLKYTLHNKWKGCITTLAVEVNTAISKMNIRDQPYTRQLVANNIQKLINKIWKKKVDRHIKKNRSTRTPLYEKHKKENWANSINYNESHN
jgi:hypothetical protein